jgi:hypothetical protein
MPWNYQNKQRLYTFLDSVESMGKYEHPESDDSRRMFDDDSLMQIYNFHNQVLAQQINILRITCSCILQTIDQFEQEKYTSKIIQKSPWIDHMNEQLKELQQEILESQFDLQECKTNFELILLNFFVPSNKIKCLADPHVLRPVFWNNPEFMQNFKLLAQKLQLDISAMKQRYESDQPFYLHSDSSGQPNADARTTPTELDTTRKALFDLKDLCNKL